MKNAFDGLISRLNMAEKRISELENMTIETSKTEKQREKKKNLQHKTSKNCGATTKSVTYIWYNCQKKKKWGGKKQYMKEDWLINFLQINVRH